MLKDITLGQYYQTESVIHRLDPRVKLVATIAYILSLFLVQSVWGYLVAALFLGVMIRLSNVPFKFMVRGMKSIVFLLLLTVIFNLFTQRAMYFLTLDMIKKVEFTVLLTQVMWMSLWIFLLFFTTVNQ